MEDKPRILRILNRFIVGGPVLNVSLLSKYLEDDFETLLIGGLPEDNEESSLYIPEKYGVKPFLLKELQRSLNPSQDWKAYWKIRQIIREFKPDIVHTHASKAGAVGRLAAKHENVPVIVHTFHGHVFHSYFGPLRTTFYKNIERYLARQSDLIVAISDKLEQELTEVHHIANPDKVKNIPLGFDLDAFFPHDEANRRLFRDKWKLDEDVFAVGIIGRIVPVKNHLLLIRAAAKIKDKLKKKVRFVIVGDGTERPNLEVELDKLGLTYTYKNPGKGEEDFLFTSWEKDIPQVLAGLDMVCLCSFNEGTPVSLIEAQASGKAILSTAVGGIENAVIPNKSALLSSTDLDEFSEKLITLIENDALRSEMEGIGRDFVLENFHYKRLASDFKSVYIKLLEEKKRQVF